MVDPSPGLSRDNFGGSKLGQIRQQIGWGMIDSVTARVLILMVL
jgi:hypothetical protein